MKRILELLKRFSIITFLLLPAHKCVASQQEIIYQNPACRSGLVSWYGDPGRRRDRFHGRTTASGEKFDTHTYVGASRTIPFGSLVKVFYKKREVLIKIIDRGPFTGNRKLDISYRAALALGMKPNKNGGRGVIEAWFCVEEDF